MQTRRWMRPLFGLGIAGAVFAPVVVLAMEFKSMQIAGELGSVLAAEEFCGLTYNQDAIARFVETKVRADDMSFASTLEMMTAGKKVNQQGMSASAKTAHCTQIRRVAKSYGFVEN